MKVCLKIEVIRMATNLRVPRVEAFESTDDKDGMNTEPWFLESGIRAIWILPLSWFQRSQGPSGLQRSHRASGEGANAACSDAEPTALCLSLWHVDIPSTNVLKTYYVHTD